MKSVTVRPHLLFAILLGPSSGYAGQFFAGYELGEMALNRFRHFAGEAGYVFENRQAVRVSIMNVALSERHLSSSEASAVNGNNVEGRWRGLDVYFDFPVFSNFYLSPSIGYHDTQYTHTILNESVTHNSGSAGVALSYVGNDVLGFTQLYWRLSLTYKYFFNSQSDASLGDTMINGGSSEFVPLLFIGHRFR